MADPIADRMTPEDRAKYEAIQKAGYGLLREAHELYMAYAKGERK